MHLAKTFGLRVLTLSPPGVLANLVAAHRVGPLLPPRDEEAIAAFLAAELRAFVAGTRPTAPAPVDVERYDRRVTAGQFAQVMALARGIAPAARSSSGPLTLTLSHVAASRGEGTGSDLPLPLAGEGRGEGRPPWIACARSRQAAAAGGGGKTWSRKAPGSPSFPSIAAMAMLNISRAVT